MPDDRRVCRIRRFDPSAMKPHSICMVVARRGSGKTTLIKDLLYHQRRNLDFAVGICPTIGAAEMMRTCIPRSCVYDHLVPRKIDEIVEAAQTIVGLGKSRGIAVVLDDCVYDKSFFKSTAMRSIFFNGRHFHITLLLASQYVVSVGPELRAQVDYVFALRDPVLANRLNLHKMFFGCFATFDDFNSAFEQCTQNFECLVLDNTVQSNAATDCVAWYKASTSLPEFKVGKQIFYNLDERARRGDEAPRAHSAPEDRYNGRPRLHVIKEE
jgi:hypothetical protein